MEVIRGQKIRLADVVPSQEFDLSLNVDSKSGAVVSCFGLDGEGRLSDGRYFIFYDQGASPCSSIVRLDASAFRLNLRTLPPSITRIVFAVTLEDGRMSSIGPSSLVIASGGEDVLVYRFSGSDFSNERAIMAAELYFKDQWRLSAIGQGFNGGLDALLSHFGGEGVLLSAPPAPAPKVNLGKVTLEKRGDSGRIDLTKKPQGTPIHINLQWDEPVRPGFLARFRRASRAVDLDLGCMYRLKDGKSGVVQPLGNAFGSRDEPPYILLDKDDRSGESSDGENIYVYRPEEIGFMVIFAMIYEGTALFSAVNGRVTVRHGDGAEILVPLNNPDEKSVFCAAARVEPDGSDVRIVKDELYFSGHQDCDQHYGFGFRWKPTRK
ncbi:MAG: TerD domain-containing protein [Synergistaceae bacterium]|jgi:tellurite resistance protein TerA|nr:TerD domain-containing protein [Synergistaceae bacterium]